MSETKESVVKTPPPLRLITPSIWRESTPPEKPPLNEKTSTSKLKFGEAVSPMTLPSMPPRNKLLLPSDPWKTILLKPARFLVSTWTDWEPDERGFTKTSGATLLKNVTESPWVALKFSRLSSIPVDWKAV